MTERVREGGARSRRRASSTGTSGRRAPGKRQGSKVRGVGVTVGPHGAGSIGWDSIMTIRPDGKLYVQSGVGNLGHAFGDGSRARRRRSARHAVGEGRGHLGRHRQASALDVSLGGQPDDARDDARQYGGRRWTRGGSCRSSRRAIWAGRPTTTRSAASACTAAAIPGCGLSFAQAARRAIELGGRYDGHELPEDINPMTRASATALAGLGTDGRRKGHLSARRRHLRLRRSASPRWKSTSKRAA